MTAHLRSPGVNSTVLDPAIRIKLARYIRDQRGWWRRQLREAPPERRTLCDGASVMGRFGYRELRLEFEHVHTQRLPE